MDSNARFAGYFTLLILLLLAAAVGGLFRSASYQSRRVVHLLLPETGSLIDDDPVTENGVLIGRVAGIEADPAARQALVEIELYHRGFIPADSRFVDFNQAPLGSRSIVLVPGRSAVPLDASRIQQGYFAPSVVEAMYRVEDLVRMVGVLQSDLERLFLNDQAPLSPQQLNRKMTESMLRLQRLIQSTQPLERQIANGTGAFVQAGNRIQKEIQTSQSRLDSVWFRTDGFLNGADSAENQVARDLTLAGNLLARLQDSTGVVGLLLRDRSVYDGLKSSLQLLQETIEGIQKSGPNKKIRFRRNIHFVLHHSS